MTNFTRRTAIAVGLALIAIQPVLAQGNKVLTIGSAFSPVSLDPSLSGNGRAGMALVPAYEPLVRVTPDGKFRPALATAWEMAPDSKSVTFTIRTDAKFSDGDAVTADAVKKSIEYFNQAIEKDPTFALAYAGLADYYVVPANPLPPREKMPKAKAAAMRALELDDTLAEAHATLARTLMIYDWEWAGAEKEFKRAIELNAGYPKAHQWYGGYLDGIGRRNEAITEAKRARELDPLSPIMNFEVGMAFYYNRDYDKAIEQLQETLALDADFPPAHGELPAAYELKGMYDKAVAGFQKGIAVSGTNEWYFSKSGLGHVYAVSGKTGEARAVLNELRQLSEREYVPADRIALIYAGLGEKDQAFAWLEKAYGERSFNMAWLKVEPRWDSLRDDPRFAGLLKRMNLPE